MRSASGENGLRSRAGYLLPAIAVALLVVGLAMALVLDRLWIDAARLELRTAAEAAALAGASRLVDDELLGESFDSSVRAQVVRDSASEVAAQNVAVGESVRLDASPAGDIRLGQIVKDETGRELFLETDVAPSSVLVYASRTRAESNPVALFFRNLTGHAAADVVASAEATIDGRTVGVRSVRGASVPAVPLAILMDDPANERTDTWRHQIEERGGADRYSIDPVDGTIREQPDGIPEILLHGAPRDANVIEQAAANVHMVDVGTGLVETRLGEQIRTGFTADHLRDFGGRLRLDDGPLALEGAPRITGAVLDALRSIGGEPRICLLYESAEGGTSWARGRVWCVRLAAGRVMAVSAGEDGAVQIVFQPTFVTTRSAILREDLAAGSTVAPDIYVYKLHLTQ